MKLDPIAHSRTHELGSVTLRTLEAGPDDGPVVFLLHGFPEFSWGWRKQVEALADQGFRVIAPDQRGYNLSSKPVGADNYHIDVLAADIIALADRLGARKFRLVGHDWGGLVSWWIATQYPEWIERLVIMNAPHPGVIRRYMMKHPRQILLSSYAGFFQIPKLPELVLGRNRHAQLKKAMVHTSRRGTFHDDELDRYEEAWSQPGALTAMINWYRAFKRLSFAGRNLRVRAPTMIVWGSQDSFLQRGLAKESLTYCDDARIRWLEEATHWLHLEDPETVNAWLIEFLEPGKEAASPRADH